MLARVGEGLKETPSKESGKFGVGMFKMGQNQVIIRR